MSGGAAGFVPLVAALEAAGHACLAWSVPGYDGTPSIEPYTLASMAAILQADLGRRRIERPVLIGHSMGGMLALECAATWPTAPAALVLACTVPAFRLEGAAWEAFLARRLAGIDAPGGMAATALAQQLDQARVERRERHADAPDPLRERRARQRHIAALGDLLEAAQGQVIDEFAHRHPRQ